MNVHPTEELGLYALGVLEGRELTDVMRHLDACTSCRAELLAHERTVGALAHGAALAPPHDLRDTIVAHHARFPFRALPRLAFAAAVLVGIVLAVSLASTRGDLERTRSERDSYAGALEAVAADARVVPLVPRNTISRGALVVAPGRPAYLVLDLEPPSGRGNLYEAWIIRDGAALAAGVGPMRAGVVTIVLAQDVRPGDVAAVTIEAVEVQAPTGEPILAGGF